MGVTAGERVALVTGGTDGIGRAVALELARGGDRILFVGRNAQRGARVLAELRETSPGVDHAFLPADLSLLSQTARVADEVARRTNRLDAAVFCAGILSTVPEWTSENLERNFVLNYLTRYLLARLLLPALREAPSGRLVFVANAGVYRDSLDLEDLQYRRGRPGLRVAGRTQFANDLLAVELAERATSTRVEVTCVFPGLTDTALFRNARGLPAIVGILSPLVRLASSSSEAAAPTPVFLAQDARAVGTGGRFYGPKVKQRAVPARVRHPDRRRALWRASEDLVRPYLPPDMGGDDPRSFRTVTGAKRLVRPLHPEKGETMSRAGTVYENPITGEWVVIRLGVEESGGDRLVADLYVRPGGAVSAEHLHPDIEETFTVLDGRVGFRLDGREDLAEPGRTITVPPTVVHDWWNAGEDEARVVVELRGEAVRLTRFETMISTLFGLAREGKTDAKGRPNLLQTALFAREFDDVMTFARPPRVVQRVMFGALAPVARLLGYRATYPRYGPSGFVEVEPWQTPSLVADQR